jgi:hypothetical protein
VSLLLGDLALGSVTISAACSSIMDAARDYPQPPGS